MRSLSIFTKSHQFPYKNFLHLLSPFFSKKQSSTWAAMSTLASTPATTLSAVRHRKIVVIIGPTGCGKTKLSIDLASRFFPSEIINSDKIQVHRRLDITTNKIPLPERKNVRHHLLGEFDSSESHPVFTPSDFRSSASCIISQILSRRRLPLIVGGSNSFIYALLAKKFNPELDVFSDSENDSVFCKELRYQCCFIWVDVSLPILNQYLVKRVDDMLDSGMFEELAEYFENPGWDPLSECGLKKAIGVPEFEGYFTRYRGKGWRIDDDDEEKRVAYEEAVRAIKDNTCQLATRQVGKILRLRKCAGWELKRVDSTAALREAMEGGGGRRLAEIWERQMVEPSVKIVKQFLME